MPNSAENRTSSFLGRGLALQGRAGELNEQRLGELRRGIDRTFLWLLPIQWVLLLGVALFLTPKTWIGAQASPHVHVIAALALGALLTVFPIVLIYRASGELFTRLSIAFAEMMIGALFIHMSGGRLETHFFIFAAMPLLACYRDLSVLYSAAAVVAVDHALRGIYWPESVFGVISTEKWRWVEHGGWVALEVAGLRVVVRRGLTELGAITRQQAQLEHAGEVLENQVEQRTRDLESALKRAESGVRARTEFLNSLTHELHTPLNGVIAMTESAMAGAEGREQRETIAIAHDSACRLLGLVDDLLELTRLESLPGELPKSEFLLRELLADVAKDHAARAQERGVFLSWLVAPTLPNSVLGPAGPLRRLLHAGLDEALRSAMVGTMQLVAAPESEVRGVLRIRLSVRQVSMMGGAPPLPVANADEVGSKQLGIGHQLAARLAAHLGSELQFQDIDGKTKELGLVIDLERSEASSHIDAIFAMRRFIIVQPQETVGASLSAFIESHGGEAQVIATPGEIEAPDGATWIADERLRDSLPPQAECVVWSCARRWNQAQEQEQAYLELPPTPDEFRRAVDRATQAQQAPATREKPGTTTGNSESQGASIAPDGRALRILVVEDNPVNQRVARGLLERQGCACTIAEDGQRALDIFADEAFDLVFMDLQMPVMGGLEATRKIREAEASRGTTGHVPIVALTANDSDEDRRECALAGMDGFLSKPIQSTQLSDALHRYVPSA